MSDPLVQVPPRRSRTVTVVAVANFVLGGLWLWASVGQLFSVLWMGMWQHMWEYARDGEYLILLTLAYWIVLALISTLIAVLMPVAGTGVLRRRRWGRWLTLVLGGVNGLNGARFIPQLAMGLSGNEPNSGELAIAAICILIQLGYCALVYCVLLNRRFAAEFA
jgi:hypothetical protein